MQEVQEVQKVEMETVAGDPAHCSVAGPGFPHLQLSAGSGVARREICSGRPITTSLPVIT